MGGHITLKVNTAGNAGKMRWQARIYSSDPANPVATIAMQLNLKPAVVFWPIIVFLKGSQEESVTASVRIEGKLNKALRIEPPGFDLTKQVNYDIIELEAGKVYEVRFVSVPGGGKRYRGVLKLKTGYKEKPEIEITVWGDFAN